MVFLPVRVKTRTDFQDLEGELPLVGRRVRGVVELDRDRYLRQRRTSGVKYLPLDKDRLGTNGRHGADG